MAIVVSDTSPVRCLVHVGRLDILPALFGEVLVPPAVVDELAAPSGAFPPVDVRALPQLRIVGPRDTARVRQLLQGLDLGESEAIALALEVQASVILIDEFAGRAVADSLGLTPVGVIGVLTRAKHHGLVPLVKPLLDRMIDELNFFVSPQLREASLRRAGEEP